MPDKTVEMNQMNIKALVQLNRLEEANEILKEIQSKCDPNDPELKQLTAFVLTNSGDQVQAKSLYEEIINVSCKSDFHRIF